VRPHPFSATGRPLSEELSGIFYRYSVTRLHCKEGSHAAKVGVVPASVNAAESLMLTYEYVSSLPAPDAFFSCVCRSRLSLGNTEPVFPWLPVPRNEAVGRCLPRHRSSLNVAYKIILSYTMNIFFVFILILIFLQL
jgi:hypothetical protein